MQLIEIIQIVAAISIILIIIVFFILSKKSPVEFISMESICNSKDMIPFKSQPIVLDFDFYKNNEVSPSSKILLNLPNKYSIGNYEIYGFSSFNLLKKYSIYQNNKKIGFINRKNLFSLDWDIEYDGKKFYLISNIGPSLGQYIIKDSNNNTVGIFTNKVVFYNGCYNQEVKELEILVQLMTPVLNKHFKK